MFGLLSTVRSFSTSAIANFPKLKTHSGAKKRWRAIASGKFKRVGILFPMQLDRLTSLCHARLMPIIRTGMYQRDPRGKTTSLKRRTPVNRRQSP